MESAFNIEVEVVSLNREPSLSIIGFRELGVFEPIKLLGERKLLTLPGSDVASKEDTPLSNRLDSPNDVNGLDSPNDVRGEYASMVILPERGGLYVSESGQSIATFFNSSIVLALIEILVTDFA